MYITKKLEITVTMDAETFEQFRSYQKSKEDLENKLRGTERYLREKLDDICSLLLAGVIQNCDAVSNEPTFDITNPKDLVKALDLAFDWIS